MRARPVVLVEMGWRWGKDSRQELATNSGGEVSTPLRSHLPLGREKGLDNYPDHCGHKQAIPLDTRGKMA
jgi:hypothetical protein